MAIRIYFEKLSPGLHARLDARYRSKNSIDPRYDISSIRPKVDRNGFGVKDPVDIVQSSCDRVK